MGRLLSASLATSCANSLWTLSVPWGSSIIICFFHWGCLSKRWFQAHLYLYANSFCAFVILFFFSFVVVIFLYCPYSSVCVNEIKKLFYILCLLYSLFVRLWQSKAAKNPYYILISVFSPLISLKAIKAAIIWSNIVQPSDLLFRKIYYNLVLFRKYRTT